MKLLFFIATNQRHEIANKCFRGLHRIIEHAKDVLPDIEVDVFVIVSNQTAAALALAHGFKISTIIPNMPLGKKMNEGLRQAMDLDWDYLIQSGDDNLYGTDLLVRYAYEIGQGTKFFGLSRLYFYDLHSNRIKVFGSNQVFGAGRVIARSLLENMPKVWPDAINKGLDNASEKAITDFHGFDKVRVKPVNFSQLPYVIDIKTEHNIHSFQDVPGDQVDEDWIFDDIQTKFPEAWSR